MYITIDSLHIHVHLNVFVGCLFMECMIVKMMFMKTCGHFKLN